MPSEKRRHNRVERQRATTLVYPSHRATGRSPNGLLSLSPLLRALSYPSSWVVCFTRKMHTRTDPRRTCDARRLVKKKSSTTARRNRALFGRPVTCELSHTPSSGTSVHHVTRTHAATHDAPDGARAHTRMHILKALAVQRATYEKKQESSSVCECSMRNRELGAVEIYVSFCADGHFSSCLYLLIISTAVSSSRGFVFRISGSRTASESTQNSVNLVSQDRRGISGNYAKKQKLLTNFSSGYVLWSCSERFLIETVQLFLRLLLYFLGERELFRDWKLSPIIS